jgi:hypothetical protein
MAAADKLLFACHAMQQALRTTPQLAKDYNHELALASAAIKQAGQQ